MYLDEQILKSSGEEHEREMSLSPVGDAGAVAVPAHDFHLRITT